MVQSGNVNVFFRGFSFGLSCHSEKVRVRLRYVYLAFVIKLRTTPLFHNYFSLHYAISSKRYNF